MLWPSGIRTREESSDTNSKIRASPRKSLELMITMVQKHILGRIERRTGGMLSVGSFSPLYQKRAI